MVERVDKMSTLKFKEEFHKMIFLTIVSIKAILPMVRLLLYKTINIKQVISINKISIKVSQITNFINEFKEDYMYF